MRRKDLAKPSSSEGRRRILEAARTAFATYGFEGASLRAISAEAGVLHTAMLYHFNSKEVLWRAVMAELFEDLEARFGRRRLELQGAPTELLARKLLRDFVHFCAERPQLHRIMTIEGRSDTDRLAWLVDRYTRPLFEGVLSVSLSARQAAIFGDPIRLYYALIGLAASTFTLAPEFKRLSQRDPFDPVEIEATAGMVERLIFGPPPPIQS
jgi:TetR/AcrR family transcriptional regulator